MYAQCGFERRIPALTSGNMTSPTVHPRNGTNATDSDGSVVTDPEDGNDVRRFRDRSIAPGPVADEEPHQYLTGNVVTIPPTAPLRITIPQFESSLQFPPIPQVVLNERPVLALAPIPVPGPGEPVTAACLDAILSRERYYKVNTLLNFVGVICLSVHDSEERRRRTEVGRGHP
jgi:hypothetical protein